MSIYNKDNHWSLYIGVMTETTSYRNQRKFNIYVSELAPFAEGDIQPELFEMEKCDKDETDVQKAVLQIQKKFGKNAMIKAHSLEEFGTTIERNKQIGGHKA